MTEGTESVEKSTPATAETTSSTSDAIEDKTTAASASTSNETPAAAASVNGNEDKVTSVIPVGGEKRKVDDETKADLSTKPKKAKIAFPPAVSSAVMDVDKYKLESPPPENNTNEADVTKKITTANLMLFGLHPLIKEGPLRKMLEDYGTVQAITVRSAFASRYCHISFEKLEEARKCYVAIHGAKLLHKAFLVQPSMASAVVTPKPAPEKSAGADASKADKPTEITKAATAADSAGAAAAAAAASKADQPTEITKAATAADSAGAAAAASAGEPKKMDETET